MARTKALVLPLHSALPEDKTRRPRTPLPHHDPMTSVPGMQFVHTPHTNLWSNADVPKICTIIHPYACSFYKLLLCALLVADYARVLVVAHCGYDENRVCPPNMFVFGALFKVFAVQSLELKL